ncbi:hypothetical protein OCU04_004413 [Sclerotinia nivalis]|uniref:BZIP domain-containing protein n=1 Tax=Sclerotinia nivalis TaxID=352851 RepID=A0A9X0ATS0_9HELO|nr:hypothetical protein OCU04_004413 [Sclerotinia nivalis]
MSLFPLSYIFNIFLLFSRSQTMALPASFPCSTPPSLFFQEDSWFLQDPRNCQNTWRIPLLPSLHNGLPPLDNLQDIHHICENTHIREGTESTYIREDTHISEDTYVREDTHISEDTYVREDTHISENTYVREDTHISENTHILKDTYVREDTHISEDTYISENTRVPSGHYTSSDGSADEIIVISDESDASDTVILHKEKSAGLKTANVPAKREVKVRPMVRKEGRRYRRGPVFLSEREVERLVGLGDDLDRARNQRKRSQRKLKATCKKLQKRLRKIVNDEVCCFAKEGASCLRFSALKNELEGFGLKIKEVCAPEGVMNYNVNLEFNF